uniref:Holliday junction resolvase n=1 Tax=viral metagenome TaxID=1070528 RepID=A0A6C0IDM9_9ZZZZ
MRIMAFDIGIHHFAWAKMRCLPGTPSALLGMDCHDFGHGLKTVDLYHHLLEYLRSLDLEGVETVLIEQQMNRMNIVATKMAVFVHAFFIMSYPHLRVIEYPSYHKTKKFGVHGLSKPERKKWSVQHVVDHVLGEKDPVGMDWLEQFPKKDDICDCILMIESFRAP